MQRRSWITGGSLLLASALLTVVSSATGSTVSALNMLGAFAFTAAIVVFTLGIPDGGGLVPPRSVGAFALLLFGVWPSATAIHWTIPINYSGSMTMSTVLGYVEIVVPVAAGIIAVVAIARAGVVPAPWNGAPAWALGATILPPLVAEFVAVASPADLQAASPWLAVFGLLVSVGVPGFLGVLALLLAPRLERVDRSVPVPVAGVAAGDR
jgi:hypothetical protein